MIFLFFVVIFAPLAAYEFHKVYKERKVIKNENGTKIEYFDSNELIPYFDLNDSNGYRILEDQEVFIVSFSKRYPSISYCNAVLVPATDPDYNDVFHFRSFAGASVPKNGGNWLVFVVDRNWKKESPLVKQGTNSYSNIDEVPFSYG